MKWKWLCCLLALALLSGCGTSARGRAEAAGSASTEQSAAEETADRPVVLSAVEEPDDGLWDVIPASTATGEPGITGSLTVDVISPETERLEVVLENPTEHPLMYGNMFQVEAFRDGAWETVGFPANYGFTLEGINLYDRDISTKIYPLTDFREPLTPGLYRLSTSSFSALDTDFPRTEYPPLTMEFLVREGAETPVFRSPEEELSGAPLPLQPLERDWQWYTVGDGFEDYRARGSMAWQTVPSEDGRAVAVLYHEGETMEEGELLCLDVFDRVTGEFYPVFSEPTLDFDTVTAMEGGFVVESEEPLFLRLTDGELSAEPAPAEYVREAQVSRFLSYETMSRTELIPGLTLGLEPDRLALGEDGPLLTIDNQSEYYIRFAASYALERQVDGEWTALMEVEREEALVCGPHETASLPIPAADLEEGIYRAVLPSPERFETAEALARNDGQTWFPIELEFLVYAP